jgi:hypothetical protein
VERRQNSVVMACSKEPGGAGLVESGPREMAIDPVAARARLPYPVCLAMQSGNENSLREAVRQLVEGAV